MKALLWQFGRESSPTSRWCGVAWPKFVVFTRPKHTACALLAMVSMLAGTPASAAAFVYPKTWSSTNAADVKTGGTYLNYTFSDFRTLNWFMTREVASLPNILGGWGLFAVDPTNLQPIPYMAESYTLSPDRLVWTIQLRSGMKWSDETPITAKDFVTTVAIARDPDTKSVRRDDFMLGDRPIRFEAITATTLRVTFPNLDVSAFDTLSFAVQPAHVFGPVYAKKGGAGVRELWGMGTNPQEVVTSGPFVFAGYRPGERAWLKRNPYFGEWNKDALGRALPYLDAQEYLVLRDQNQGLAQFLAGNLDVFYPRGSDDLSQIRRAVDAGNLKAVLKPNVSASTSNTYLTFNWNLATQPWKQKLFQQVQFRRAMSMVANREAMVQLVFGGLAQASYSRVPGVLRSWISPTLPKYEYDLEQAARLLAGLGFSRKNREGWLINRDNQVLEFELLTGAGNTVREGLARIFVDEAKKIGVKVNYRTTDLATVNTLKNNSGTDRKWDAILATFLSSNPNYPFEEAIDTCSGGLSGFNRSGRCLAAWESQADALFQRGRRELNLESRRRLAFALQDAQASGQGMIWLVSPNAHFAWNARVQGEYPATIANSLTTARDLALTWISNQP
jgi:peptide/nickel transport system substrate-binding protein